MRLVSLWWELPPWLDSNNRIWNRGTQELFLQKMKVYNLDERDGLLKGCQK
jgi:hypothetical protein